MTQLHKRDLYLNHSFKKIIKLFQIESKKKLRNSLWSGNGVNYCCNRTYLICTGSPPMIPQACELRIVAKCNRYNLEYSFSTSVTLKR